jgi:hypothetical protein
MEVRQRSLMTGILMAALMVAPLAEAKRAGGGKSHGMTRTTTSSQTAPAPTTAPTQQKSGSGVGGMVAAGVAGAAIGAVAANAMADDAASTADATAQQQEEKGGLPGWIWILLAAAVAFFLFRKFGAKKKASH